jgi:membrane protein required for beta-lactamase induction
VATLIRFLIEVQFESREQKSRLLGLYGERFNRLVREAKAREYFALDYRRLPAIRELLGQRGTVERLIPVLRPILPEAALLELLEVGPVFNLASVDLQAYILLSLGVRDVARPAPALNS